MTDRLLVVTATALLMSFAAADARASTIVLDQQNTSIGGWTSGTNSTYEQGVTAGLSGQLVRFDVLVPYNGPFAGPGTDTVFLNLGAPWQSDANDFSLTGFFQSGVEQHRRVRLQPVHECRRPVRHRCLHATGQPPWVRRHVGHV